MELTCRRSVAALCVAGLAAAQALQGPQERGRAIGIVRTTGGEPRGGATVALISRPVPSEERVGELDRVVVKSDRRGRFRAQILLGRAYSVYASAPAESGVWLTQIEEQVLPNRPIVLVEGDAPRVGRSIRYVGLDAWRDKAPFRAQVVSATANVEVFPLELGDDGRATLPVLPGNSYIELFGKDDFPLGNHRRDLSSVAGEPPSELEVLPPTSVPIAVRDIDTGTGIPGARILALRRGKHVLIGETAADGLAILDLPVSPDEPIMTSGRQGPSYLVVADGYAVATLRSEVCTLHAGKPLRAGVQPRLYCHLGPSGVLRGRVWLRKGVPAD